MHCSASLAFALLNELIKELDMLNLYRDASSGFQKHSYIIEMLIRKHLPDINLHFQQHEIFPEQYASEWLFGLFCTFLTIRNTEVTGRFFGLFLEYKWELFYKLILTILDHLRPKLLRLNTQFSLLQQLKLSVCDN